MADRESGVAQGDQREQSGVTSEQWKQVETLFEQALEIPADKRSQFLRTIADDELRREVESLLAAHEQSFLDQRDRFFSSESFEADTLSPGQIIDRYRIIREIGPISLALSQTHHLRGRAQL